MPWRNEARGSSWRLPDPAYSAQSTDFSKEPGPSASLRRSGPSSPPGAGLANARSLREVSWPTKSLTSYSAATEPRPEEADGGLGRWLLLEIPASELGLLLQRLTPEIARLIELPLRLQGMPQIQQRFREVGPLGQSFLVKPNRILDLTGFLQQQPGVVEQLRCPLARFDQLGLQVERFVQILAFDGQCRQTA